MALPKVQGRQARALDAADSLGLSARDRRRLEAAQVWQWIVTLQAFAGMVDLSHRTIANDLTARDRSRRARWPEFRKVGRRWLTTTDAIRAWHDAIDPASLSPAVARAIERAKAS
jgi:hypothetical protein